MKHTWYSSFNCRETHAQCHCFMALVLQRLWFNQLAIPVNGRSQEDHRIYLENAHTMARRACACAILTWSSKECIIFWKSVAIGLDWGKLEVTPASCNTPMPLILRQGVGRACNERRACVCVVHTYPPPIITPPPRIPSPPAPPPHIPSSPPAPPPQITPPYTGTHLSSSMSTNQLSLVLNSSPFFR